MSDLTCSRRAALLGAAALPVARVAGAQARPKLMAISSANRNNGGINACNKAVEVMRGGGDTLDAVIAGANIVELDPRDTSVGYGGLPNEDGVVELDASCVHGPTRRMGAVGALQNIKTPSLVAKRVMEDTDHMFLVGTGALKFAKAEGFREENLLTEESRLQWLLWKRSKGRTFWGPGVDAPPEVRKKAQIGEWKKEFPWAVDELLEDAYGHVVRPPHGTINCIALNERGEMSAVTTTSGMAFKLAGRLGDSPVVGGGLWLDQDVGGAGSTGRGEENLRVCGAHTVVENMRRGLTPREAIVDTLKRVSRNFNDDLNRLQEVDLSFYALRNDGQYAGGSLWNHDADGRHNTQFAVATSDRKGHHEETVYLYERR
jgi:N4-(beta-N-acetylglucosaminyl)-L-asparaginase